MKALVYYDLQQLGIEELDKPQVGETDVLVRIVRAGICGSDLTAYLYDGMKVGILKKGQFGHDGQFGHEMVGIVEKIGRNVYDVQIGDRVFINLTVCKRNGMMSCNMAGAFSQYVLVEDGSYTKNLKKLADDVTFDQAVIIEPLAVGTHGKNCIHVQNNDNVVIFGAGTIGLCTLAATMTSGCQNVVVVDTNPTRLALVEKMDATGFNPKDGDLKAFLCKHFGALRNPFGMEIANVDVFINCAGTKGIINQMIDIAKDHARIAIVAVYKENIKFNAAKVLSSNLTVVGSCGYEECDVQEAFNYVNTHQIDLTPIITHHYKHEDAIEAFAVAANPQSGAIKVVVDYE